MVSTTFLGGGSIPTQELPTYCVAITPKDMGLNEFADRMRRGTMSVFGRVQQEKYLVDLRSVLPHQDSQIAAAVSALTEISHEDA